MWREQGIAEVLIHLLLFVVKKEACPKLPHTLRFKALQAFILDFVDCLPYEGVCVGDGVLVMMG